jgi:hypothetical protein
MSKNVISHPKFAKVVKGKTPHFNIKGTYMVLYAHTSILSPEMAKKGVYNAIEELCEEFPERKEEFEKTIVKVCMPTKYDVSAGHARFQDFSNIYISNYDVGQAVCGFNYNGSMRKRIVCSTNTDVIDLGKEIEDRFPDYEPLDVEKRRECFEKYKSIINKMTEAKRDTFILNLNNCIDHPDRMDILLDIIFKHAQKDNFKTKNFIYMIMQLSVAEVIKVVCENSDDDDDDDDDDDEDKPVKPEKFIVSIFHVKLVDRINSLMADVIEKKITRHELMNTAKFIGELFAERAIDLPLFSNNYRFLMDRLFSSENASVEDSDMMIMIGVLENSCIRIHQQEPELIEEFDKIIADFGELKHQTLMEDIYRKIKTNAQDGEHLGEVIGKGSISAKFRFENLKSLCTIPAIAIPPSYTRILEEHVLKEKIPECTNLEYCGMTVHTQFVLRPVDIKKHWEIISPTVPKWVSNEMLREEFALYNTSDDFGNSIMTKKYPIVTSKEVSENCKSIHVEFSQEGTHFTDALFALKMLGRMKLSNQKHNEHVVLAFGHAESFERKSIKGKGGK